MAAIYTGIEVARARLTSAIGRVRVLIVTFAGQTETFRGPANHCLVQASQGYRAIARRLAADWHDGQTSRSRRPRIGLVTPAIPLWELGRSGALVANAGWDVVDAGAPARSSGRRAG